jgi:carboxymethylenebutenolidase
MPEQRGAAGPDLGAIFDLHVASEFETEDLDATMATMVDEPYVTHIPTLAGGVGGAGVRRFYRDHFIGHWPDTCASRTCRAPSARRAWWTRW